MPHGRISWSRKPHTFWKFCVIPSKILVTLNATFNSRGGQASGNFKCHTKECHGQENHGETMGLKPYTLGPIIPSECLVTLNRHP